MSYKRYTKEFKQKVLREVEQGLGAAEAARRFGLSRQLIYEWQQRQRDGTLPDPELQRKAQLERQIVELERMVGQLTMENEFLKKTLEVLETRYPTAAVAAESQPSGKSGKLNKAKVRVSP
jgi:transposase-like protein